MNPLPKKHMFKISFRLVWITFFVFSFHPGFSETILVGANRPLKNLISAARQAKPGDTIRFQGGIYQGGEILKNLKGLPDAWITIFADTSDQVIIRGHLTSWQFTDPEYIRIEGFTFEEQTANGVNIDDGGDYSTPAQHIIFKHCTFRNIKATGNNDLLKLSGLDHFEIVNCQFLNGSPGGSGVDMVGCHRGKIEACRFENQGSNSIQAKGGSQHILIFRNLFVNGGQRSVNSGGSTGTPFFRPLNATFEAADLEVYSNIFVGSDAPIAFVGCIRSKVINNTIYKPGRWVVRILQENADPRFIQCGENSFENNLIVYENLRTETNVGPNTRPETFRFNGNFWFDTSAQQARQPVIPVHDESLVFGKNPKLVNLEKSDFWPAKNSPATKQIKFMGEPETDFYNRPFNSIRSFGAIESE
jgi:hypothetical protein